MRRRALLWLCVAAAAELGVAPIFAGKFNRVVDIGDKAAQWKDLIGIDDKQHSLADYEGAEVLVFVFISNHCPVATAYEDRLIQFTKDYKGKAVQVVAINVSNLPSDRLDQMKVRAKEKGFHFPYLYDPTQKVGRDYGATATPHAFVLDKQRKIAYMGAIDDNQNPKKVTRQYLRDAVDAVLGGTKPEFAESRQFGCAIAYEKQE
jgi:peroxiredoxin